MLARRTRLSFINVHAAQEALPRVVEMMAQELKWSDERQKVGVVYLSFQIYKMSLILEHKFL